MKTHSNRAPRVCALAFVPLCLLAAAARSTAQTPPQECRPPAAPTAAGQNIFSPQQEADLGDAVAEHVQRNFRLIEDDGLNAYLRRIGERVAAKAPDVGLRFRFFLIDLPEANAFTMPGGRIYVSRKLVALSRSEDELAGVIAHEIGHGVARQLPVELTKRFREVLGVTSVGDRADVFDKYNQLVENSMRKPARASNPHGEQTEADRVGLYALALAGYDPQAQAALWDRLAETKGKTGGFLSDLFGTTSPEARRLREMLKALSALPAACLPPRTAADPAEFARWQSSVVGHTMAAGREDVRGVVSKTTLDPPLRGEVTHLKFSPDGRHVLAQDDTGVNVLTREPLAPLFRIDAPEAYPARFTPDSRSVVFHTPGLRVEAWDVSARKLAHAREMHVREGCLQTELAPDGKTLACLEPDTALTLFDAATGEQLFQKKGFFKPSFFDLFAFQLTQILAAGAPGRSDYNFVSMGFSPDGRYFAAGDSSIVFGIGGISSETAAVAFDVQGRAAVNVRGQLKKLLTRGFAFLGPDRIVAIDPTDVRKSGLYTFPAGEPVEQFPLAGRLEAAAKGNYVILRPVGGYGAGAFDLATKKVVVANRPAAMDVYEDFYVGERRNGEIGLYRVGGQEQVAAVVLPRNPLGLLRAADVSPDFRWLVVSERSRGAVWDLTTGRRVHHVRGFRGAHVAGSTLYADFPAQDGAERTVARVDLATGAADPSVAFEKGARAAQYGPLVLFTYPLGESNGSDRSFRLEVKDAATGASLWTREFRREPPRVWPGESGAAITLAWPTTAREARDAIKRDPRLSQQLSAMREKEGDYYFEVLDARTGATSGRLLVETGKGSFRAHNVEAAGDLVFVSDGENRTLAYSLATGELRGRAFGDREAVSRQAGLLAVENERGRLALYDLAGMQKRDEFTFATGVSLARFSPDGRRLFVLTADQTAYVLDLAAKKE
jgi:WD40 repeat protein